MRLKPLCNGKDEGDSVIKKISTNSLSINSHSFSFDSILHADATQARFIYLFIFLIFVCCLLSLYSDSIANT